ncbi:hypothetical protein CAC42_7266 [Sphaceloma murrayae]|uniref:Core domain-containing protein n=1 Tax=Sphaceloma murrayae TaxID=2082308 RepID=A0A2K1QQA2_9PEZI|nr:hypothetical protein CAC42_7266 [Sphaceloma murrayae]
MASRSVDSLYRAYRPLSSRFWLLSTTKSVHSRSLRTGPGLGSIPNAAHLTPPAHVTVFSQVNTSDLGTKPRNFSGSSQRAARAISNPRKDDDGKEMIVDITPRAASRLHAIAEKDNKPDTCLRVTVESGGCHGFQYLMSLTTLDQTSSEEDTVFESEDGNKAKVVMDEPSLELLKGSKIDYTMELIGSQFKVTGIPA